VLIADLAGASRVPEQNTMPLGLLQCAAPIKDLFVHIAELNLTTVDKCSLANCTNEFLIGAVHQTAPVTMHS